MIMDNEKQKKIDAVLNSLDNTRRAMAPDFFYTRLKAKMEKGLDKSPVRGWYLRPAYALAVLVVVVLINAFVVFQKADNGNNTATSDNESSSMQSIAAEYSLNDNGAIYESNQER